MKQSEVVDYEQGIFRDKISNFRGKARVMLNILQFTPENMRDIDKKNIDRLKDIFDEQGCLKMEPERHIPAIVSMTDLAKAIEFTASPSVSIDKLLDNPKELPPLLRFPPGVYIECLTGKHRIQAAKECTTLKPSQKWWIVDLYLNGLSQTSKRALSEEYSNSKNFSDGVVYRKIEQYRSLGDRFAELQCWARLSKSKRDILRRFFKHESFSSAFNRLLDIHGLWVDGDHGFSIGTLHKAMGMKIDEEVIHYTEHILTTFDKILGGSKELMRLTDSETVEQLQSRAPGASRNDWAVVTQLMGEGRIFPEVRNGKQREDILRNLGTIRHLIPTIYSLRQDVIYIKPCAMIVRRLFMGPKRRSKSSIREAAEQAFSGANQRDDQLVLQTSESSFKSCPGSLTDQIEIGYRHIFSYAMRWVLDMVPECARKEDGQDTPQPRKPNPRLWQGIGTLAYRLGFESKEIHRLRRTNPDEGIARDALLAARDPRRYKYPDGLLEDLVKQITEKFETAVEISHPLSTPSLFVDGPGEGVARRCGRLEGTAYEDNQQYLFFEHLNKIDDGDGNGVTSFFVRKSVYKAFFGTKSLPSHGSAAAPQNNQPPNQDAIIDGQEVTTDGQEVTTGGQEVTMGGQEVTMGGQEVTMDDQGATLENQPIRARMYPVGTERPKKIILSQRPDEPAGSMLADRGRGLRAKPLGTIGASQNQHRHSQTPSGVSSPLIARPSQLPSQKLGHQQKSQAFTERTVSISIWENGDWKQVERDCTRDQVEGKVMHHVSTNSTLHPYDMDGRGLYPQQCFDAVVNEDERTVWLARPEDHSSVFPVEIEL